jgi:hypothetical protein
MIHKHEKNAHPGKPLTKLARGGKTNMQIEDVGSRSRQGGKPEEGQVNGYHYLQTAEAGAD